MIILHGPRKCNALCTRPERKIAAEPLIVYIFSEQCVALFSPEPEVIAVGVAMMHILVPTFWVMALREVLLGILRGCGRNLLPTVLSLIGMIDVRQVFLIVTMHRAPVIENIYYCYPVAWAATLLLLALYYLAVRKNLLPNGND